MAVLAPASSLYEVELELDRRRRADPLELVYKPRTAQQEQVHRSRAFTTLVLGGNRTGKSWSAVAESQYYALGRNTWAEVPEPPIQVWYVIPSGTMYRRSIKPIMQKIVPSHEVKRHYERDGIVVYNNGTEMHIVSADMKQRRLQGASIHFAIIDETPDESIFEEVQARVLDTHGRMLIVFAPIDAATYWVRDKLYLPWASGERKDIEVINMPVADRETGRSLVPWFTDTDIERMKTQWPDPQVQAARMYGEFIVRSGMVFRSYEPRIHLVKPFEIPDGYSRWMVVDPQYHRFAALYFAADEYGNYYVTDEYFSQDEKLAERAERLSALVGKTDKIIPVYVDSANPQDVAELNWHFQRLGAPLGAIPLPMRKEIDKMILRTQSVLEPNDESVYPKILSMAELTGSPLKEVHGAPRLMFFNTLCSSWVWNGKDMVCSRLLWELQRLSWGKNGKPDKESAAGADCCDCLVYGCSIMQTGMSLPDLAPWKKGLSAQDIRLWSIIDMVDGQNVRED